MNVLKLIKLQFVAKITKDLVFPGFLGNTIRGALGNSLVHLFCSVENVDCEKCPEKNNCVYSVVFKSNSRTQTINQAPNPFIIEVPNDNNRAYKIGDKLIFGITLIGSATDYAKLIIMAVNNMFNGIFANTTNSIILEKAIDFYSNKIVFEEHKIMYLPQAQTWSDSGAESIEPIEEIQINFISPVQILQSKKLIVDIDFPIFIDSLFSRIADLMDIYGDNELILPYNLSNKKPYITTSTDFKKVTIKQEKLPIEGLKGTIAFSGNLTRFMPYIDLGTQIHIGKLTTRGFGQYDFIIE